MCLFIVSVFVCYAAARVQVTRIWKHLVSFAVFFARLLCGGFDCFVRIRTDPGTFLERSFTSARFQRISRIENLTFVSVTFTAGSFTSLVDV